jgi:lipopolysaccharide transport system permease protein
MSAIANPPAARAGLRNTELVLHLARRELAAAHRFTALGWAWPLARQLVQLGVLVLIFSSVIDLGIANFPAYVFSGIIAWNWFASGLTAASTSLLSQRHLVFQPRLPTAVLPIVAIAVPFVDVVMAVPVLLVMAAVGGTLQWTVVFLPVVFVVEFVLMCGFAWAFAALTVYVRDVPNLVGLALLVAFYMTPVFYSLHAVPDRLKFVLKANPMTTVLEAVRALTLGGAFPAPVQVAGVVVLAGVVGAAGWATFNRMAPGFADEL